MTRARIPELAVCASALLLALTSPAAADPVEDAVNALTRELAEVRRSVLDNGMVCLVREDHSAPVSAIQIWIAAGSAQEQDYLGSGITHAIEHMIFKGTDKRPRGEITRAIDDAGGKINAYTSLDRTVFHTEMPSGAWRVGLDVLADAVMNARFPAGEWDKEKEVIVREIAMRDDDPDSVLDKLLSGTVYRVHPYRHPVIGYREALQALSRQDLVTHFSRNYTPDRMTVAVVGDVSAADAEAEVRKLFAGFQRRRGVTPTLPQEPPQLSARFARRTGQYEITRLQWAYPTVALSHPDAVPLDVLAQVVGDGRSSRLVKRVKEDLRLVHSIGAWSYTPQDGGLFGVNATLDAGKETEAIAAVRAEVAAWHTASFSRADISRAVRSVLNAEVGGLRTMDGQASSFASGEFYAGDPAFALTYLRRLRAVTPAELRRVARTYLVPERETLAAVSPPVTAPAAATSAAAPRPEVTKTELPGGIPLLVREDGRLPQVYLCAALRGGILFEDAAHNGVTRLTADLLTRGTAGRSADDIARTVESLGASLAPFSGYNSLGLNASCFASDAPLILSLMAECLLSPVFPSEEVEKQRTVQLASIDEQYERPMFVADQQLRQMLFSGHPYGLDPLGTRDSVGRLRRDDLAAHWRRLAVSGNLAVAIFGAVKPDDARRLAEAAFRRLPAGEAPVPVIPPPAPSLPARVVRPEPREQAIVLLGFPGVSLLDPRYDALTVATHAMSGLSSDLGIAVREDRGLAYYVGAYQRSGPELGSLVFYAGTRQDAAPKVEELMRAEACRLAAGGLRDEELVRARKQLIADADMDMQDNGGLAMNCALNELYGLGYAHALRAKERFEAVTAADVRTAATALLTTNRMAVSVVVPAEARKPAAP
jgi:zinc protease